MKNCFSLLLITLFFQSQSYAQSPQTFYYQPGPEDGKDAYINSSFYFCNTPNGNTPDLIASAYTYNSEEGTGRSLFSFDFSNLPPEPVILSATLSLYYDPANGHGHQLGDNACYLKRIISPWDEQTVTWNTQPLYTEEGRVKLDSSVYTDQDYLNIDVTDLVKDMTASGNQNYGFALVMIRTIPYCSMIFASSDNPVVRLRPRLEVVIQGCEPPVPAFGYVFEDGSFSFQNQSLGASSYFWDFGDGYSSILENPQHAFLQQGTYDVCLKATNDCQSEMICNSIVYCAPLTSDFAVTAISGSLVTFTNLSVGANTYYWDFGDGNYSVNQDNTHYFAQDGNYNVCLKAMNDCMETTSCREVSIETNGVGDDLAANITISPNPSSRGFLVESQVSLPPCQVRILNSEGKIVYFNQEQATWKSTRLPKLVPGIYILVLNTDTFAISKKLVSIP